MLASALPCSAAAAAAVVVASGRAAGRAEGVGAAGDGKSTEWAAAAAAAIRVAWWAASGLGSGNCKPWDEACRHTRSAEAALPEDRREPS